MRQDWKNLSRRLTAHLKLATRPLGFKFLRQAGDIEQIEGLRRSKFKRPLCQFIGSARYLGKAWAVTPEDQLCQWGGWCAGVFPDVPESIISGCLYSDRFLNIADGDTARQISAALPKNREHFAACAIMPLGSLPIGTMSRTGTIWSICTGSIRFCASLRLLQTEPRPTNYQNSARCFLIWKHHTVINTI